MLSISVTDNIITGNHSGAAVPIGNIEIDQVTLDSISSLRNQALSESRPPTVYWNNGAPALGADIRPTVGVTVNGTTADVVVVVGSAFTVELTLTGYTGPIIIPVFDRRFLFDFVGGVASKTITATESKLYRISSNEQFKVANSIVIDAVE